MLDHVQIPVRDLDASRSFYDSVMSGLGAKPLFEAPGIVVYGNGEGAVAVRVREDFSPAHVAFRADRAGVDAFYAAALAAGGADNGAPGLRPHYHEHYYAAFVHDPDGNNIEAVCHLPES
jgi:catechol 2,3-dioxygenase-like lactoylglutathione lyase family enzyme